MDADPRNQAWTFAEGATVLGADGEKVGQVIAVYADFVVVEKGFFFPTDYYVPTTAVSTYDGDEVILNVTKDEALHQGWDQIPAELTTTGDDTAYAEPVAAGIDDGDQVVATTGGDAAHDAPFEHHVDGVGHSDAGDTITVEVHEEEAVATTRERGMGEVRIEKDVVTTEEEIQVPVVEERLRVERRPVDREVTGSEAALEERSFSIPIQGEVVDIGKDVHVTEEVEVAKEAVERIAEVETTVRHEEVHVDDSSLAGRDPGTAATTTSSPRGGDAGDPGGDAIVAGEETPPDPDIPEPGMPGDPRNPSVEDEERGDRL